MATVDISVLLPADGFTRVGSARAFPDPDPIDSERPGYDLRSRMCISGGRTTGQLIPEYVPGVPCR